MIPSPPQKMRRISLKLTIQTPGYELMPKEFSSGTIRVGPIVVQRSFWLRYKNEKFKQPAALQKFGSFGTDGLIDEWFEGIFTV